MRETQSWVSALGADHPPLLLPYSEENVPRIRLGREQKRQARRWTNRARMPRKGHSRLGCSRAQLVVGERVERARQAFCCDLIGERGVRLSDSVSAGRRGSTPAGVTPQRAT